MTAPALLQGECSEPSQHVPTAGLAALPPLPWDARLPDATPLPCHEHDADLWFAEQAQQLEQAKALCQACPLRRECLAGALDRREPWGVWGGEIVLAGQVVAVKRGRGRPRKAKAEETAA